jgi:proteasome accessory factor BC
VAKDTEKLIRQLSLISFLMAQGRPVSALEIKREVEGYSDMNDDAFARRFYADRAELESLGIELQVEKPGEGFFEAELYSLPPENFYLPAIQFSDEELAAMRFALSLLTDEGFAYAEPLRLALQQVAWGHPNPLSEDRAPVDIAITASADSRDLSQRLSKIETAISRRKTIEFTYYTMARDDTGKRKVDPYHLVYRSGQFYLIGHSHERGEVRIFRLSRIQGKVGYASKAEHDFSPPEDYDRRDYARRADWQLGDTRGTAKIFLSDRIAWLAERDYGRYGTFRPAKKSDGARGRGRVFETDYAEPRELISWVMQWRQHAQVLDPEELREEWERRTETLRDRHANGFEPARTVDRPLRAARSRRARANGRGESGIRPERFARLVTLAGLLIEAAKEGERLKVADLRERLELTDEELVEDIEVLNVVNFGGGTYVLYAEIQGEEIEVDSEPYGDNFARPARLLPLEAKALVAAIDLFGDYLPQASLQTARQKIVSALGHDPSEEGLEIATIERGGDAEVAAIVNRAINEMRVMELQYYKPNEDELKKRRIEPYRLQNGEEGWYVASFDLDREDVRHFKLDRIKDAKITDEAFEPRQEIQPELGIQEWMAGGEMEAAERARVWVSPERARWKAEESEVVEELADGAVVIDLPYKSIEFLEREIARGAGDLVVLEPEDAREKIAKELGR